MGNRTLTYDIVVQTYDIIYDIVCTFPIEYPKHTISYVFSESARRRIGASWQEKRWPAASAREGGPRCCLEARESIEFLLRISFCGRI